MVSSSVLPLCASCHEDVRVQLSGTISLVRLCCHERDVNNTFKSRRSVLVLAPVVRPGPAVCGGANDTPLESILSNYKKIITSNTRF
jgi:hypothetical protein